MQFHKAEYSAEPFEYCLTNLCELNYLYVARCMKHFQVASLTAWY
jgi:hypothetical protein